MLFLVSNDDSHRAPGVHHLTKLLSGIGDVVAICPETPQSGKSMAITVNEPVTLRRLTDYEADEPRVEWYSLTGTPVDCIKMAMHNILGDRRPDMVCTGINHGSNAAVNVIYSGTMGAAFEGTVFGIPSVGFSLCDHSMQADFGPMLPYVRQIVEQVLREGLPAGTALNLNAPAVPDLKGLRFCRPAQGHWSDEYIPFPSEAVTPTDSHAQEHPQQGVATPASFKLAGQFVITDSNPDDTDEYLLRQGFVTVTRHRLQP